MLAQFDLQVAAQDPAARRRRMRGLHERGLPRSTRRAAIRRAPIALLRGRYGTLHSRVTG